MKTKKIAIIFKNAINFPVFNTIIILKTEKSLQNIFFNIFFHCKHCRVQIHALIDSDIDTLFLFLTLISLWCESSGSLCIIYEASDQNPIKLSASQCNIAPLTPEINTLHGNLIFKHLLKSCFSSYSQGNTEISIHLHV